MKNYYVYIMSNQSRTLYIGVTNNLIRRVYEHQMGFVDGFTKKYNLKMLVYYEVSSYAQSAITREKELKGWLRKKKLALIYTMNPEFEDLSAIIAI